MGNLFIDVGNTATKFGIDKNNEVEHFLTVRTSNLKLDIKGVLNNESTLLNLDVESVYISSVVPSINKSLADYLKYKFNVEPVFIDTDFDNGVDIRIDNRQELGIDLFCDLASAKKKYGYPLLIVDFGTATKFLYIDEKGIFSTCAFVAGLELSLNALNDNTDLLPKVDFKNVKPLLDIHNTVDVLSSSAYYGQVDMVNGLVTRYFDEIGHQVPVLITGGIANIVKNDLKFEYQLEHNLCLKGIKVIKELN